MERHPPPMIGGGVAAVGLDLRFLLRNRQLRVNRLGVETPLRMNGDRPKHR
jgi:hypothetical protein